MAKLQIEDTHPEYEKYKDRWSFYLRSYLGGADYREGRYLTHYVNEDEDSYQRRLDLTCMDNHAKNITHIYSSFLWRVPPTRTFNALAGNVALDPFLKDCDLDGRSLNTFMREAQVWASVYGHVWIMLDKPKSNAGTRAEELAQDIRPYVTMFTPENVLNWEYERSESGRFVLCYLKVLESAGLNVDGEEETFYRVWQKDTIQVWKVVDGDEMLIEELENPLAEIPAVFLPAQRSVTRGIGVSDLSDIAYVQRSIYQELSEIEQLIRISNHPTLVKTFGTDASAGAGSVINLPDDMDQGLKPYQMQPSGQNLDAGRAAITDKVESINRMSHMGAVRGTAAVTASGIALATEFQMLNSKLSEKADILQLAEEQLFNLFCEWQAVTPDVEISYPDSFDLRDYDKELAFLQQMRATGVRSVTLMQSIDMQIADLILDDEKLAKAHLEIEQETVVLGQFNTDEEIISIDE